MVSFYWKTDVIDNVAVFLYHDSKPDGSWTAEDHADQGFLNIVKSLTVSKIAPYDDNTHVEVSDLRTIFNAASDDMSMIEIVDLSGFYVVEQSSTLCSQMFQNCTSLARVIMPHNLHNISVPTSDYGIFHKCTNAEIFINFLECDTNSLRNVFSNYTDGPRSIHVEALSNSNLTDLVNVCYKASNLEELIFNNLDLRENDVVLNNMFQDCIKLANVKMPQLKKIPHSEGYWSGGSLEKAFKGAGGSFLKVDFSSSTPETLKRLFIECAAEELAIVNLFFEEISATNGNAQRTFYNTGCVHIYVDKNWPDTLQGAEMFTGSTSLVGLPDEFAYDASYVTQTYAVINDGVDGYFSKYVDPNRLKVEVIPPSGGYYIILTADRTDFVTPHAYSGYTYTLAELYSPSDILLLTYDPGLSMIEVNRPLDGEYTLKLYFSKDTDNPWEGGGESGTSAEGGTGTWDSSTDTIGFGTLPTILNDDFTHIYKVTPTQLASLQAWLWDVSLESIWGQIWGKPMEYIVSLGVLPVTPGTGSNTSIIVGRYSISSCQAAPVTNRFVAVDLGTLDVEGYSGSYLDYAPYTTCEIYLPFLGYHAIDIDTIMDQSIELKYEIDIVTGDCIAKLYSSRGGVLYQFAGNLLTTVPITGIDSYKSAAQVASAVAAVGSIAAGLTSGAAVATAVTATDAVAAEKPHIEHGSSQSGSSGLLGIQEPYLIFKIPRPSIPADYRDQEGLPINALYTLAQLTGYTVVESVHLEDFTATDDEKNEIENLLKGGVIL